MLQIWIKAIASTVGCCEDGRFCLLVTSFSERFMRVLFVTLRRLPSGCTRAMGTEHYSKERTSFKLTSLFFATSKRRPNNSQVGLMDKTLSFWLSTVTFLATELNIEMFSFFTGSQKLVWLLWILVEIKLVIFCLPSSDAPRSLIATDSGRTTPLARLLNGTRSSSFAQSSGMGERLILPIWLPCV